MISGLYLKVYRKEDYVEQTTLAHAVKKLFSEKQIEKAKHLEVCGEIDWLDYLIREDGKDFLFQEILQVIPQEKIESGWYILESQWVEDEDLETGRAEGDYVIYDAKKTSRKNLKAILKKQLRENK